MLYVLRTGVPWRDLAEGHEVWSSVYARYALWCDDGLFGQGSRCRPPMARASCGTWTAQHVPAGLEWATSGGCKRPCSIGRRLSHLHTTRRLVEDGPDFNLSAHRGDKAVDPSGYLSLKIQVRRTPEMIKRFVFIVLVATLVAGESAGSDQRSLPRLARRGHATQLIVDDRPYLVLGGELNNTAASDREYLKTVWPRLVELNVNTALVAVGWDWIEPEEGKFDFSVVDDVLQGARDHNLRVIFIWFGSWKNGMSSFAPDWVKIDQTRFPRVRVRDGKAVEILSPFGPQTLAADTAAYSKFIEHLGKVDKQRTAVMVQLQNEVGIFGDSRDRSEVAEAAFRGPVPKQLISHLQLHRQQLHPDLAALW